jgi:Zn-dependent M32 family carboxypeptidase
MVNSGQHVTFEKIININMKRIIVDYSKLTTEILDLLVEKYPDGYDAKDIISFKNLKNELVEAVEVRINDCIYLVKVGKRLVLAMEDFNDEEEIDDIGDIEDESNDDFDIDNLEED